MISISYILQLIKLSEKYKGKDLNISIKELVELGRTISQEDILAALSEIDIKISNRGILIPNEYFK